MAAIQQTNTHYQLLGVSEDASEQEVRKAFKARVFACHPDKHPGDPTATARFQALNEAHSRLIDADARQQYDAELKARRCPGPRTVQSGRPARRRTSPECENQYAAKEKERYDGPSYNSARFYEKYHVPDSRDRYGYVLRPRHTPSQSVEELERALRDQQYERQLEAMERVEKFRLDNERRRLADQGRRDREKTEWEEQQRQHQGDRQRAEDQWQREIQRRRDEYEESAADQEPRIQQRRQGIDVEGRRARERHW